MEKVFYCMEIIAYLRIAYLRIAWRTFSSKIQLFKRKLGILWQRKNDEIRDFQICRFSILWEIVENIEKWKT